ncbi:unnamed protein product [Amaranthus hypochondriacus]
MNFKLIQWSLILQLLLLIEVHSFSSHTDHTVQVFFSPADLHAGKSIQARSFLGTNPYIPPPYPTKEEADQTPFSLSKLPFLLQLMGISPASPQAKAMEDTLTQCELRPLRGETKFCATSLESMLISIQQIFGHGTEFKVLSTQPSAKFGSLLGNYRIMDEPREVHASKWVACHTLSFPYAVYHCHFEKSNTKVLQVSLRSDSVDGGSNIRNLAVTTPAVCHMNTSQWNPKHASFRALGVEHGSPVCHFFLPGNFIWVPSVKIQIAHV